VGTHIRTPPDPQDDSHQVGYLFGLLFDYKIRPENLAGLGQIASLNGPSLQVVIVEMPVPDTYVHFFGNGNDDYQRFIEQVSNLAAANGIQFWQTSPLQLIPDDGWVDYCHMNTKGARIFSEWLGRRVGEKVIQGVILDPASSWEY